MVKPLQILIAIDQLVNTFIGGMADETISARAYRKAPEEAFWRIAKRVINTLFFNNNHCYNAYIDEFDKHQLPPAYRMNNPFKSQS